jgi:hypothetical protein
MLSWNHDCTKLQSVLLDLHAVTGTRTLKGPLSSGRSSTIGTCVRSPTPSYKRVLRTLRGGVEACDGCFVYDVFTPACRTGDNGLRGLARRTFRVDIFLTSDLTLH